MNNDSNQFEIKTRRSRRVRAAIRGTDGRPRLSIFRSLSHVYGQIINDDKKTTLTSASDREINAGKATNIEKAKLTGKLIANKAMKKNIKTVVYDRGSYKYHGRVKAFAEGAREAGLKF